MIPNTRLHPLDISIPQVRDDYTVMRIGGKLAIDATKPATWRGKERDRFSRVKPMGRDDETLNELLAQVRVKR
jgi:3-polyprenyl-4-hydroxybenzoate decarboxylase